MFYEAKVAYENEGKKVNAKYILENFELFGEVESKLYEEFGNFPKFEVLSIKTNLKLKEFINENPTDDEKNKIFYATICDYFVKEDGVVKEIPYVVGLFADSMDEAQRNLNQYISQGLEDMDLKAVKQTKFISLLK